ncbi:DUF3238 domain-containing protein, partial [Puniceicoccus vermicola]
GCWNEDYNCQDCFVLSESSAENENECTVFFDNDLEELEPVDELIDPDGLNILYQRVSFSIPCPGFTPFFVQGSEPPEEVTTYLKETYTRSKVSGCTDPTDGLFGRTTTTYAVASRERCVAEEGWTHYAPGNTDLVNSDQEPLHAWSIREFEDGDNTVSFRYDIELSDAYSTDDFIRDASDMMPDFQAGFSQVSDSVSAVAVGLTTDTSEDWISYSKVRFKFEWGGDADESEKTPRSYLIVFHPKDDPDTENVDESEEAEILSGVIEWDGSSSTVFDLDPEALKPDTEGLFSLLAVDTVTISTFIPQNNVESPIPFNDTRFSGDNRISGSPPRATWSENGSHRTQQKFHVIAYQPADANGLVDGAFGVNADGRGNSDRFVHIGTTKSYDPSSSLDSSGNLNQQALADTIVGAPHMIAIDTAPQTDAWIESPNWISDRSIELTCKLDSANPLVSGAPSINYTLKVTIDRNNNTYTLEGTHDGFPAYEVYINGSRVYEHDPLETGEGIGSLFPPEEHDVDESGNLL